MNRIHKCTKKIKMNETIEDGKGKIICLTLKRIRN